MEVWYGSGRILEEQKVWQGFGRRLIGFLQEQRRSDRFLAQQWISGRGLVGG